jgi:hypothetical protein
MSTIRRVGTTLVSAALAAGLVGAGGAAHAATQASAAGHSADWLADQIHHGLVHNNQFDFDDYGLTADTVFALKALGLHGAKVQAARHALAKHVTDYTGAKKERYAGPLAKLLVLAESTGGGERSFGGINLVHRLSERVATRPRIAGRIKDQSTYGDFANVIGQIFAVRGLVTAGSAAGDDALTFLLKQQCADGYFRLDFSKKRDPNQSCTSTSPSDLDTTALAVIELSDLQTSEPTLVPALAQAVTWLRDQQKADGGFRGGTTTSPKNSNSTGLAGWALLTAHDCAAAKDAARWVRGKEVLGHVAGTPLAGEKGAIAYNGSALAKATKDGITKVTRDQWRRATAQAAPSLVSLQGCAV